MFGLRPKTRLLNESSLRESLLGLLEGTGGKLESLQVQDSRALAVLSVPPESAEAAEPLRQKAEARLREIAGVSEARVILTAERQAPENPQKIAGKLAIDAKHIIAVASGKGGVGKSTVALNLAVALAVGGLKVGLVDADIYGPSVPLMTGLQGQKPQQNKDLKIVPLRAHGIDIMSIGFMVVPDSALIWRGPMVQSALTQLLRDVAWEGLDVLIVDMPPGTGDAQLTLAQKVDLAGAIIVSTPQDVALADARKGLNMFTKMGVAILGLVENMSVFCCPSCGFEVPIFGAGGARAEAERMGCPFLGAIPLDGAVREASDAGIPALLAAPDGKPATAYRAMAEQVIAGLKGD